MLELIADTNSKPTAERVPVYDSARRDIVYPGRSVRAADDLRLPGLPDAQNRDGNRRRDRSNLLWVKALGEKRDDAAAGKFGRYESFPRA